ncbi:MAG: hypothetical protein Q7U47_01440 [Paludibacter sp.]|nr:hypothetical protein [Paludibacter sp.]
MSKEIIKVSYKYKNTFFNELNDINQQFNVEIERYKNYDYCFYILENGKRLKIDVPQRSYNKGDFVIFKISSYKVEIFEIAQILPNIYLVVEIQPYIPKEKINKVGFP